MTARRPLSAGAAVMTGGVLILLVVLYWHVLLNLITVLIVGRIGWAILAKKAGVRRRPKSSWSSLLRSGAIAFAAWNTRWLKPTVKASITKKTAGEPAPLYDPFTGKELATTDDIPY